jgi:hypothetical protein
MPLGFSILFFSLVSSLDGAVCACVYVCVSQGSKPLLVSTTSSALEFLSSVRLFLSRNGAFRELSLVARRNLHETGSFGYYFFFLVFDNCVGFHSWRIGFKKINW